jgi:arylsulfatase A-like enzyme
LGDGSFGVASAELLFRFLAEHLNTEGLDYMKGYSRHTVPIIVALFAGLVAGGWQSQSVVRANDYLGLHMYQSAFLDIAVRVDKSSLIALLVVLPLYLLIELMNLLRQRQSTRTRRIWLPIPASSSIVGVCVLGTACILAACWWVRATDIFAGLRVIRSTLPTSDIVSTFGPSLLGAAFVIAVGLIAIGRLRRQRQPALKSPTPHAPPKARTIGLVRRLTEYMVRHLQHAGIVVLAFFLLVNAAFGICYVRSAVFVRSTPNIIYIMVDTLRADHLGCYGYSRDTSPNIDRFAAGAIRFGKAISQAPWTTPSVNSFMSSSYIPMDEISQCVPKWTPLMPQILKDNGYTTSAVVSNCMAGRVGNLDRGYDWFSELPQSPSDSITSPEVARRALLQIRTTKGKRFFIFAHFMDPHDTYVLHPGYDFYPGYAGHFPKDKMSSTVCRGDDLRHEEALYDSEIAFTDHYIGKVLDELKKQGLYDDSLIVFLADHGEEFCDHGGAMHGRTLYDELLSVPLIIKLPGQHRGRVVSGNFPLIDLLPSVLKYINVDTSALKLKGTALPLATVSTIRDTRIYSSTNFVQSILSSFRSAKWKIIRDANTGRFKLFDLANDPREQHDLAVSNPTVAMPLENQLVKMDEQVAADMGGPKAYQATSSESKEFKKALRSLGYVQ